jgi:hypothetical protein
MRVVTAVGARAPLVVTRAAATRVAAGEMPRWRGGVIYGRTMGQGGGAGAVKERWGVRKRERNREARDWSTE